MRRSLVISTVLLAISLTACDQAEDGATAASAPPPSVGVTPVVQREITPSFEFVARVEAIDSVDLEARITGFLVERHFEEGASVQRGDLLFRIEPGPYEAAVAARRADLARTDATLVNATQQRERMEPLVRREAQPQARLDELLAGEGEAVANRDAARAALDRALIDLGYTEIKAPFTGRIGRAAFAEGAVVGPGSGPLARLVRLDPIFVTIPVTDRAMVAVRRTQDPTSQFRPYLRLGDRTTLDEPGRFVFIDPQVDTTTDTVRVRAEFPNTAELLLPGQFVTVTIRAVQPETAMVIPQIAVQQDQAGRMVLTLDQNNVVQITRVTMGERVDTDWIVEGGLELGQTVIVDGLQKARPGMTVQPVAATAATATAPVGS
jgi:membrane fusion protein, multidrug efflux system